VQPDNKRPPDQAATPERSEADQSAFDPGDSFSNDPSDIADAGELPSWLRSFAGTASESGDTTTPVPAAEAAAPTSPLSSDTTGDAFALPAMSAAEESGAQLSGAAGTDFFSEDDLPEWLRALSLEGQPATEGTPAVAAVAAADIVTPGGAMAVPKVSRAWVTASDVPETSSGANLLSSLVSVADSRPDVVAVEAAAPAPTRSKEVATPAAAAPKAPVAATGDRSQTTSPPVAAAGPVASETGGWSRTRILLVAAILILLILLILFLS
jgi:hypothetical protein